MKIRLPVSMKMCKTETSNSDSESAFRAEHSDSSSSSPKLHIVDPSLPAMVPIQFTNFDVHTGVPTRTTPTLTPTTLRNIEQTFIELQSETERGEPRVNEAGFVPPLVELQVKNSNMLSMVDKTWLSGSTTISPAPAPPVQRNPNPTLLTAHLPQVTVSPVPATSQTTRRSMGGRRPVKNTGISPEEEERRQIRRERNKLAAARCRKRRLDHTNELIQETECLEQKRQSLQQEIQQLQMEKEQLEFILEAHKATCRLGHEAPQSPLEYKPPLFDANLQTLVDQLPQPRCDAAVALSSRRPQQHAAMKPARPSSLPVRSAKPPIEVVNGVAITTPSSVIPLNFDSIMEGGTGLTPVTTALSPIIPSCSTQQRSNGIGDLASPDSGFPPKLVSL